MLSVAARCQGEDEVAWPGNGYAAEKGGKSGRAARRVFARLRERDIISVSARFNEAGKQVSNLYSINYSVLERLARNGQGTRTELSGSSL